MAKKHNVVFINADPSERNPRVRQLQSSQARAHAATASHQRKNSKSTTGRLRQASTNSTATSSPFSVLRLPIRPSTTRGSSLPASPFVDDRSWTSPWRPVSSSPSESGTESDSPRELVSSPPESEATSLPPSNRGQCSCAGTVMCPEHLKRFLLDRSRTGSGHSVSFNCDLPGRGWKSDPFDILPKGPNISPLIDCWMHVMQPFNDLVQNIFGVTNIFTRSFLELLGDKAFFDVGFPLLLIMIATLRYPYRYPSQELLMYRGRGLKSLRAELAQAATTKAAPTDTMIAMVAGLCTLERYLGNLDTYALHAKSLQFMVAARGGLDGLGNRGDLKSRLLQWDTFWGLDSSTTLFPDTRPRHQPAYPTGQSLRTNPFYMNLPSGFIDLAEHAILSVEILDLLVRTNIMLESDLATPRRARDKAVADIKRYNSIFSPRGDNTNEPYADFQDAYPCLGAPDTPHPNFEKLVCVAVFLFCVNAFTPIRSNSNLYSGSRMKLAAEFPRIDISLLNTAERRCLSWITMVAIDSWRRTDVSGVVLGPREVKMLWCARNSVPAFQLSWDEFRVELQGFFYTPKMMKTWRFIFENG